MDGTLIPVYGNDLCVQTQDAYTHANTPQHTPQHIHMDVRAIRESILQRSAQTCAGLNLQVSISLYSRSWEVCEAGTKWVCELWGYTCNWCLYFLQRSSRSASFRSPDPPRPSGFL